MTELREKLNNIVEEKNTKITPENLRQGVEAFGVQGTFTSDATATAEDIAEGKTAYVNGEKITGELVQGTSDKNANVDFSEALESDETAIVKCITDLPDGIINISGSTCRNLFSNFSKLKKAPRPITSDGTYTNFANTFYNCASMQEALGFDMTNVATAEGMYQGCASLEEIDLSTFSETFNGTVSYMFSGCTNLKRFKGRELIVIGGEKITHFVAYCSSLTDLPALEASNVSNVQGTFLNCSALTNFGGLLNIGKAYTQARNNYTYYKITLSYANNLTHESLMNVINGLYDLNLTYNVAGGGTLYTQQLILGATNLAKLTAEEIRNSN